MFDFGATAARKNGDVLHGIAWILRDDPSAMLGYISYQADIARSKSRLARDYAKASGVVVRSDADALHEWLTTRAVAFVPVALVAH